MPRRPWRCRCGNGCAAAIPLRIVPTRGGTAEVSAVPPRRSAVLTVFRGVTAINDGNTAELRRSWRCHCGLCRTSTAVAPHLRCDGGRRSAVLTVFRGATAINDGTTAEPRRSWRCHYGLCRKAPQWHGASGVTGVLAALLVSLSGRLLRHALSHTHCSVRGSHQATFSNHVISCSRAKSARSRALSLSVITCLR